MTIPYPRIDPVAIEIARPAIWWLAVAGAAASVAAWVYLTARARKASRPPAAEIQYGLPALALVAAWIAWRMPFEALDIRWYALSYMAGLVVGWRYCAALVAKPPAALSAQQLDDLLVWVTFGVVLGGRIGYVLVYKPGMYLQDPIEILRVWHGGMSFHGGCAGVFIAIWLFARQSGLSVLAIGDLVAGAVPIGLFFGRIANFINGELWGRQSDVPWAMVFPDDPDHLPRHPSQLYEATLEGLVLFLFLAILEGSGGRMRRGAMTGWFLIGYAVARSTGELFREPDAQLRAVLNTVTMGQILCIPMLAIGAWLVARAKRPQPA